MGGGYDLLSTSCQLKNMSNYYVSNCCGAQCSYIDTENEQGVCNDCKEHCGLILIE